MEYKDDKKQAQMPLKKAEWNNDYKERTKVPRINEEALGSNSLEEEHLILVSDSWKIWCLIFHSSLEIFLLVFFILENVPQTIIYMLASKNSHSVMYAWKSIC